MKTICLRNVPIIFPTFYFLLIVFTCPSMGAVNFDSFLNLFKYCVVKLNIYNDVSLYITQTPVFINWNQSFLIEASHPFQPKLTFTCIALFYVLPDWDTPTDDEFEPYRHSHFIDTRSRFDILVEKDEGFRNTWFIDYKRLLLYEGITSHGLILKVKLTRHHFPLTMEDKIWIVNRMTVAMEIPNIYSQEMGQFLNWGSRWSLDDAMAVVYKMGESPNLPWVIGPDLFDILRMLSNAGKARDMLLLHQLVMKHGGDASNGERIHRMVKGGHLTMASTKYWLTPRRVSEEGQENYLFAFMALGENFTWNDRSNQRLGRSVPIPSITFKVENAELMMEKESGMGFVTCFNTGYYYQKGIIEWVVELLSIFQPTIYVAILATYVAPCVLMGCLYHFILKKNIQEKCWIKWHPFTWGIRSLIWQAGDRKLNNQRFGWTAWMVGPLMLMTVVLSYAFRGDIINKLGKTAMYLHRDYVSFNWLHWSGAVTISDDLRLEKEWPVFHDLDSYRDIADKIQENRSVVFVTKFHRAEAVANMMGRWSRVKRGRMWYPPRNVRNWEAQRAFFERPHHGWVVKSWGNDRVVTRLKMLEGPSGIFTKWRKELQPESADFFHNYFNLVFAISMGGNISYVFVVGLEALALAMIFWIGEWVLFKTWTQPRKRRMANRKREMVQRKSSRQIQVETRSEGNVGNENVDMEILVGVTGSGLACKTKLRSSHESLNRIDDDAIVKTEPNNEVQMARMVASNDVELKDEGFDKIATELVMLDGSLKIINVTEVSGDDHHKENGSVIETDMAMSEVDSDFEVLDLDECSIKDHDSTPPSASQSIKEIKIWEVSRTERKTSLFSSGSEPEQPQDRIENDDDF